MRQRGMTEGAILAALLVENAERCDPPKDDEEVAKIAASIARYPAGQPTADPERDDVRAKLGQRDRIIMVGAKAKLWHDADHKAYATVEVDDHNETYALKALAFRRWLLNEYGKLYPARGPAGEVWPSAPSNQALIEGLGTLEAMAARGEEYEPGVRIAERKGSVYIDLGTPDWTAIKVTADDWKVVKNPRVKFVRPNGLRKLPRPEGGGDIELLRSYVNVGSDDDFKLVVGWLVGALAPRGPYPVLVINGEQGSAKSTLCRLLRRLIDPNLAELRSAPKNELDLVIAANNGHVIALDNLSFISSELADGLCRIATGVGFGKRQLYTDIDEIIIQVCRPQIVNGIPDLATRSDLADRSIVLTLPPLPDGAHRPEKEFWDAFDRDLPRILGTLCEAVTDALDAYETLRLPCTPRMADFANWVEAASPALGWEPWEFLAVYEDNRAATVEMSVDADPVATAIKALVDDDENWEGTATDLLRRLNIDAADDTKRLRAWPKDASHLSNRLRRAAPALRKLGVAVVLGRRRGTSHIELSITPEIAATAATSARAGRKGRPVRNRGGKRRGRFKEPFS